MPLKLPAKSATPSEANIAALKDGLTSVIAGHPGSTQPYTFYEEVDTYLGPWGTSGYPISYGKFYCIAFNSNKKLMANADTKEWVRKTTIALQESLRDYIVSRFRSKTLSKLTEAEFRQYAFDTHPAAYTAGGLALVVMVAPELIPVIATIPGAEFDPRSPNFGPTVVQVFKTLALIGPQMVGTTLAAAALPAHNGSFKQAFDQDLRRFTGDINMTRYLSSVIDAIKGGQMDDYRLLAALIKKLNDTQFGDQGLAAQAAAVVAIAKQRQKDLLAGYAELLKNNPNANVQPAIEKLTGQTIQ